MMKIEHINVMGFEGAIRGMRNPMNSWEKSDSLNCNSYYNELCNDCDQAIFSSTDSYIGCNVEDQKGMFKVGRNDLDLMKRLYKAGTEHRKYARQIFVSLDITAPLYWWKEFDTYKVGTTSNSCSTMHKIQSKEFVVDDFSCEHLDIGSMQILHKLIITLNYYRTRFNQTKDKSYWWQMIQLLPTSYNQKRTITMTYENVFSIINQRSLHKLDEWIEFTDELKKLPYVREITE